jgi:hypothetical protein
VSGHPLGHFKIPSVSQPELCETGIFGRAERRLIGSIFAEAFNRKFKRLTLDQHLMFTPTWNNSNAASAAFNALLAVPVYQRLNASGGFIDSYLNNPPPAFRKNPVQVTLGLTYALPQSAADDHFAQVIAGEKKLHGMELLEELLQTAIVEILNRPYLVARSERHDLRFHNAVRIERRGLGLFFGVEKRQQRRLRTQDAVQPVDGLLQQRRGQELEGVPDERAVESAVGKFQVFAQKQRGPFRIGLIGDEIAAAAEGFFQGAQGVVGVDPVTHGSDEADIGLAGSGKIQDGEIFLVLQRREELIQAVTGAILRLRGARFLGWGVERRCKRFGSYPVLQQSSTPSIDLIPALAGC